MGGGAVPSWFTVRAWRGPALRQRYVEANSLCPLKSPCALVATRLRRPEGTCPWCLHPMPVVKRHTLCEANSGGRSSCVARLVGNKVGGGSSAAVVSPHDLGW